MKLVAIAVLTTATVAAAEPRHDVEAIQVGGASIGAMQPTMPSPTGTSALADSRIIYLNRSGVTVKHGSVTDSRIQQSTLPPADVTIPPWNATPALWSATVACVRDMFAPFEVQVVESDPGNVPHMEGVFGGTAQPFGAPLNTIALASHKSDCGVIENSIVFVFTDSIKQDAQFACELVAQALGHSYGLNRELLASDTMSTLPTTGPRTFQDQSAACGDTTPQPCCGADQNSFAFLTERIGNSDVTAPVVTITSPGDGEQVQAGFTVVVAATDNLKVRNVTLTIDGIPIGGPRTSPPYEFATPVTLADGQHLVKATASDGKNEGDYITYVTVTSDEPITPRHGGGCAATSGGRSGLALAVVLVGLRRKRRLRT